MEYHITNKEAVNIKVEYIFKLDSLQNHMNECIGKIRPIISVLPDYKHLYKQSIISTFYNRLERMYEVNKLKWKYRDNYGR
tara:strand:+ start:10804 stop:11046 length:243 start_codon:yes stop_codon:yes gene_type:complete